MRKNSYTTTVTIVMALMVCVIVVALTMAWELNNMSDPYALEIKAESALLSAREDVIRYYGLDLDPYEVEITEGSISYNSNRATRQPDHSVDLAKTNDDIRHAFAWKNEAETIKSHERSFRWAFRGLAFVAAVCFATIIALAIKNRRIF